MTSRTNRRVSQMEANCFQCEHLLRPSMSLALNGHHSKLGAGAWKQPLISLLTVAFVTERTTSTCGKGAAHQGLSHPTEMIQCSEERCQKNQQIPPCERRYWLVRRQHLKWFQLPILSTAWLQPQRVLSVRWSKVTKSE